jgi:hypothetical protein
MDTGVEHIENSNTTAIESKEPVVKSKQMSNKDFRKFLK